MCPLEKDGFPCTIQMGLIAAVGGATAGAIVGGAGGTFVVPGVGTVVGMGGGAFAGGTAGLLAGTAVGFARDVTSVVNTHVTQMGRISRTIGKIILIGLGAFHPEGPVSVPMDIRQRDNQSAPSAPSEEQAVSNKPPASGEPPKDPDGEVTPR